MMIIMKDREIIARNLINIIDVSISYIFYFEMIMFFTDLILIEKSIDIIKFYFF